MKKSGRAMEDNHGQNKINQVISKWCPFEFCGQPVGLSEKKVERNLRLQELGRVG